MLSRRALIQTTMAAPFVRAVVADPAVAQTASLPWIVYYANDLPANAFEDYRLLVFEPEAHPELAPLKDAGREVYGYISLGEVEQWRDHYDHIRAMGILRDENAYWPGSYFVDVRDGRWVKTVIEDLVPQILRRGFQGLFLDTLDNPPELERRDPARYAGITESAVRLVRALKLHYPRVPLILNRGYELLPKLASVVDYVLGESVYADYDFDRKTYGLVPKDLYRQQVDILKRAQRAAPNLTVLTLDYWDPADKPGIARIYAEQRSNGFHPYVSVVELDIVVPEPKA